MLNLFLSRSLLKKLINIKNILKKIDFKIVIFIFINIVFMILADVFFCIYANVEPDKTECAKIEEIVLSHESEIVEIAHNYNLLTTKSKDNLELEFDEIKVKFDKNSDEKIILSAKINVRNSLNFVIADDKLEKQEDNLEHEDKLAVIEIVAICFIMDFGILFIITMIFLAIFEPNLL